MAPATTTNVAVAPARPSGQQARIEKHAARIADSRREILELTLERARIEAALATFEHEYAARVGSLYGDLDRVQLDIKELLYRARLVEKGITRTQDHLDRRVENAFRRERERVEADGSEDATRRPPRGAGGRTRQSRQRGPVGDAGETRRLYLRLAKRYHPDKSHDDLPEGEAERLMALINDAYEAEDVRRLRQIAATLDDGAEQIEESPDARERRLFREALEVDRAVRDVRRDLERLRGRETYAMMCDAEEAQARGDDLIGALRADLVAKLDAARQRMSTIRAQFETLAASTFSSWRA